MNFYQRLKARRAAQAVEQRPTREFSGDVWYHARLPVSLLEPHVPRVSRVVGEKFERLKASIAAHGLANPLITVSELPSPNFDDWREFRFRFLFECKAPIKVVVGHNRHEAIRELEWTHVPVLHCGPIPAEARRLKWKAVSDPQSYIRDGRVGLGPFSLTMVEFTPPLKGVPAGFEAETKTPAEAALVSENVIR